MLTRAKFHLQDQPTFEQWVRGSNSRRVTSIFLRAAMALGILFLFFNLFLIAEKAEMDRHFKNVQIKIQVNIADRKDSNKHSNVLRVVGFGDYQFVKRLYTLFGTFHDILLLPFMLLN